MDISSELLYDEHNKLISFMMNEIMKIFETNEIQDNTKRLNIYNDIFEYVIVAKDGALFSIVFRMDYSTNAIVPAYTKVDELSNIYEWITNDDISTMVRPEHGLLITNMVFMVSGFIFTLYNTLTSKKIPHIPSDRILPGVGASLLTISLYHLFKFNTIDNKLARAQICPILKNNGVSQINIKLVQNNK